MNMKARVIHLGVLDDRIKNLMKKQEPAHRGFLEYVRSEIKTIDQKSKAIFEKYQAELFHPELNDEHSDSIQEKFNQEYKIITMELTRIANDINEKSQVIIADQSSEIARSLKSVAEDIIKMTQLTPKFVYNPSDKLIYSLCAALGGVSIKIGQDMLPTAGVVESDLKKIDNTGGICGGMVLEWIDESVRFGTCRYPVTSTQEVLRKQDTQNHYKSKYFKADSDFQLFETINFESKFNLLVENIPYLIIILGKTGGHGLGIRKHRDHIEIFDPNYGYFFFREIKNAATWMSILFQHLYSVNFPCENILFLKFQNEDLKVIPESTYPTSAMLDQVSVEPYSQLGYQKLIEYFRKHLNSLLRGNKDKVIELILKALLTLNQHLYEADSHRLVNFVNSLINPEHEVSLKDQEFIFGCRKYYNYFKRIFTLKSNEGTRDKLLACKLELEKSYYRRLPIDPQILSTIENFDNAVKNCHQKMYDLSTILSDEMRKKDKEMPYIKYLRNYIDVLNLKRRNLRRCKIASKLRASVHGVVDYTLEQAKADMDNTLGHALNVDMMEPHLSMLTKIDRAIEGFLFCKDQFHIKTEEPIQPEGVSLHQLRLFSIMNTEQSLLKIANKQLLELERIRNNVLEQNNLD